MDVEVRKISIFIEQLKTENGMIAPDNHIVASIAVTAANPYAGGYSEELTLLSDFACGMAKELLEQLMRAANLTVDQVVAFGKGAIIGEKGEIEHASALLHPTLGSPVRAFLQGTAIMPSTTKMGSPGTTIDVPLKHKSETSLSHASSVEVCVSGSPKADEFVMVLSISNDQRPFARHYKNAADLSKLK